MALIGQDLTASGTEATYTFPSALKSISFLTNDHATQSLEVAFDESVDASGAQVIKLLAGESVTNVFIGNGRVMYYKASGAGTGFRLVGSSD